MDNQDDVQASHPDSGAPELKTDSEPGPTSSSLRSKSEMDMPSIPELPRVSPELDFPDGGWRAWTTIAGSWLVLFSTFGFVYAFGIYQDYYTRIYLNSMTPSAVSWIGSFQSFIPLLLGYWIGNLFDRGYFHYLMISGSTLFVFSMFMLSLAKPHQYYQIFLSQAVGMGLGLGLVLTPAVSITSHYFRRRRALATGIALSGSSVGGIVHPILLNNLFQKPNIGFAGGTRASAYMLTGCLLIANLIMRTRKPPSPSPVSSGGLRRIMTVLRDPAYVLTITGAFCCQLSLSFPSFYIQLYSVNQGIRLDVAFYCVAILNAGSVIGRIIPNLFADMVGEFNLVIPCVIICTGLMFSLLGITNTASMSVVAIFYGIASGAYNALSLALVASLCQSPAEIGLRIGVAYTTNSIGALVGVPIAGALLTDKLLWMRSIIFSAACVFLGAVFFTAARHVNIKRQAS